MSGPYGMQYLKNQYCSNCKRKKLEDRVISLKDSSGLGGTYETKRSSEEENPVHRQNTTVHVDKIRSFRPPYVWMKTFVFLLTLDRESTDRCFLCACYGNP